jgi:starch synthase
MPITFVLGPGHHGAEMVDQLASRGAVERVFQMWPRLTITDREPTSGRIIRVRAVPGYGLLSHAVWAAWRRLPVRKEHDHPRTLLYAIYDRVVSLALGRPEIFWGWSQVSEHALRRARARGAVTVLEHPMLYIDHWQALMREEYSRHGEGVDHFYSLFPEAVVARMKREYAEADRIVVASSLAEETFVRAGVPREKMITIPYGVDTELFRPAVNASPSTTFRVLYVGRLELLKGVHYLLEAWNRLALTDARLTLVGMVLPEIHPVLARGSGPSVRRLEPVKRTDLPLLYADADAVVTPSLGEGFGLTIIEAMSCGVPVIATEDSAARDVITDGVDGFRIPIRDVETLADRLRWCHGHRQELREMGKRARQSVVAGYRLSHYGDRLHGFYQSLTRRA